MQVEAQLVVREREGARASVLADLSVPDPSGVQNGEKEKGAGPVEATGGGRSAYPEGPH